MEISTIGLDLAKNAFQVHGISASGEVVIRKAQRRSQMLSFFEKLPPCPIGAEACGTSHHWAREQKAAPSLHRVRNLLIKQRTQLANMMCSVLAELGHHPSRDTKGAADRARDRRVRKGWRSVGEPHCREAQVLLALSNQQQSRGTCAAIMPTASIQMRLPGCQAAAS